MDVLGRCIYFICPADGAVDQLLFSGYSNHTEMQGKSLLKLGKNEGDKLQLFTFTN